MFCIAHLLAEPRGVVNHNGLLIKHYASGLHHKLDTCSYDDEHNGM